MRAVQFEEVEAARAARQAAAVNCSRMSVSWARPSSRGVWLEGLYGSGDGATTGQLPSGSGSSMPSHISLVEPLRPLWPSCTPIAVPGDCACTKSVIRFQATACLPL